MQRRHIPAVIALMLSSLSLAIIDATLEVPALLERQYPFSRVRQGDLNIGLLNSIHDAGDTAGCTALMPGGVLGDRMMEFVVDQINDRNDLLPNVTIGFIQTDDCWNAAKALEVAVYFVEDSCDEVEGSCKAGSFNSGSNGGDWPIGSKDVVGIIGPYTSSIAVAVAPFLGIFRVPVLGLRATANALSDKSKYPFFMRLVPTETVYERTVLQVSYSLSTPLLLHFS